MTCHMAVLTNFGKARDSFPSSIISFLEFGSHLNRKREAVGQEAPDVSSFLESSLYICGLFVDLYNLYHVTGLTNDVLFLWPVVAPPPEPAWPCPSSAVTG